MLDGTRMDWYMFQVYIPISNSEKTTVAPSFSSTWGKYSALKDTIVLSKSYKKMYHVYTYPSFLSNTHLGYIREDSLSRKVYFLDKTSTTEELLYDFSVGVGDSVLYTFAYTTGNFPSGYYKVLSINNVNTQIGVRKQFNLRKSAPSASDTLKYIESIGSLVHPLYTYMPFYVTGQFAWAFTGCPFPYAIGLACKYNDVAKYFQSCTYVTALSNGCIFKYDSCNYWNTCSGLNELEMVKNFVASPNPASSHVKITIDLEKNLDCSVAIYDISGRLIKNLPAKSLKQGANEFTMDLSNIQNGLYFIKVKGPDFELHRPLEVLH